MSYKSQKLKLVINVIDSLTSKSSKYKTNYKKIDKKSTLKKNYKSFKKPKKLIKAKTFKKNFKIM